MSDIVRRGTVKRLATAASIVTGIAGAAGAAYLITYSHEVKTPTTPSERQMRSVTVAPESSFALSTAPATWMFQTSRYTPEPTTTPVVVPGTWMFLTKDTPGHALAPTNTPMTWIF